MLGNIMIFAAYVVVVAIGIVLASCGVFAAYFDYKETYILKLTKFWADVGREFVANIKIEEKDDSQQKHDVE